jgi:hypothetical protein
VFTCCSSGSGFSLRFLDPQQPMSWGLLFALIFSK